MPPDIPVEELEFVRIDRPLIRRAVEALEVVAEKELRVVSTESCTGGLLATILTEAPGASDLYEGGFVTYTAEQKALALSLDLDFIRAHGTVSREVTVTLAEGALKCSAADLAIAITGVAGPEKDEKGNPIGLVYLACTRRGETPELIEHRFGDIGRAEIRYRAAEEALTLIERVARKTVSVT